jgi:hypothetical protein
VNCENSKLSSIIYKYAYLQHAQNGLEMPWIKAVKNILDGCGFSNIWENQGNFHLKWGSLSLKQTLFDQFLYRGEEMGTVVHNGIHHQSQFYHICYMSYFVSQCLATDQFQ